MILIAALGFAAVSATNPAPEPEDQGPVVLPKRLDARVAAAAFASLLEPQVVATTTTTEAATTFAVEESRTPEAPPDTPTTTTTVSATTTSTTTTAAPTTTTTAAPPTTTTTTTTAPPSTTTTTTAAPTTTTAPTTTSIPPDDGGPRDVEEWRPLAAQYFRDELVDDALSVMRCESLGDPMAYNSASGASGLYQFIPGTWAWAAPGAGFAGASPFDAEANIATAAWLVHRSIDLGNDPWSHWSCRP